MNLTDIVRNYKFIGTQDIDEEGRVIALYNCKRCKSTVSLTSLTTHYMNNHMKPEELSSYRKTLNTIRGYCDENR